MRLCYALGRTLTGMRNLAQLLRCVRLRAVVLISLAAIGACSNPGDQVIDVVFDPCAVTVLVTPADTSDGEREALEHAIAAWNAVLPTRLQLEPGDDGAQLLPIRFEKSAPLVHGAYLDELGEIVINRRLGGTARDITVAHELGHAFGLWHADVDEGESVMTRGNLSHPPTEADALALRQLWGRCPERLVAPGAAHAEQ